MEDNKRIDDYWEAFSKYGNDETPHILAEWWGWSVYRVEHWIKQGEEEQWL